MNLGKLQEVYKNIMFFDCETTGFDPVNDRIIELAMTAVTQEETFIFDQFVKPDDGRQVPEKITQITNITNLDVYGGCSIEEQEAADSFLRFMEKCGDGKVLLVAHNAQFDLNFIAQLLIRAKHKEALHCLCEADYLDTLTVYKDRAGFPHKLQNAIIHYGLDGVVQNSHRAVDDTKALAYVTEKMAEERDDLMMYVNVFGYNSKYGVSGQKLKKVTYAAQGMGYDIVDPSLRLPVQAGKAGTTNA